MSEDKHPPIPNVQGVTLALSYDIPCSIHPHTGGTVNVQFKLPKAHKVVLKHDAHTNHVTIGLEP